MLCAPPALKENRHQAGKTSRPRDTERVLLFRAFGGVETPGRPGWAVHGVALTQGDWKAPRRARARVGSLNSWGQASGLGLCTQRLSPASVSRAETSFRTRHFLWVQRMVALGTPWVASVQFRSLPPDGWAAQSGRRGPGEGSTRGDHPPVRSEPPSAALPQVLEPRDDAHAGWPHLQVPSLPALGTAVALGVSGMVVK